MKYREYKASVTDNGTPKVLYIGIDYEYTNKKDVAHDLRRNGYKVRFISTPEKFETDRIKYFKALGYSEEEL